MPTLTASNPVDLKVLLANCAGGEMINLAGWAGSLSLSDLTFPANNPVVLNSTGGNVSATSLKRCVGLVLTGGGWNITPINNAVSVLIDHCQDVTITGATFPGHQYIAGVTDALVKFSYSARITIVNNLFRAFTTAISGLFTDTILIDGNKFRDAQNDCINLISVTNYTVTNNDARDFKKPLGSQLHQDFIQMWALPVNDVYQPNVNGNISNNTVEAYTENQIIYLTLYLPSGKDPSYYAGVIFYEGIVISGNRANGSAQNTIAVYHGQDVLIEGNTTGCVLGSNAEPRILVQSSVNVTVRNNIVWMNDTVAPPYVYVITACTGAINVGDVVRALPLTGTQNAILKGFLEASPDPLLVVTPPVVTPPITAAGRCAICNLPVPGIAP